MSQGGGPSSRSHLASGAAGGPDLYFVELEGTRVGPYSRAQLESLLAQGRVAPDVRVQPAGTAASSSAQTLAALLAEPPPPAPQFPPDRPEPLEQTPTPLRQPPASAPDPSRQLFEALQAARERKSEATPTSLTHPLDTTAGSLSHSGSNASLRRRAGPAWSPSRTPDQLWLIGTVVIMLGLTVFGITQLVRRSQSTTAQAPSAPAAASIGFTGSPAPRPSAPSALGSVGAMRPGRTVVPPRPSGPRSPVRPADVLNAPPDRGSQGGSPASDDGSERSAGPRERPRRDRPFQPRKDIRGDVPPDPNAEADAEAAERRANERSADEDANPEGSPAPDESDERGPDRGEGAIVPDETN